jgi:hypothetical protein
VSARPTVSAVLPRRFALVRHIDYTGVSGVGVVAYGVAFADGQIVLRWCSKHPATSMWTSVDDLLAVHGHGDTTTVEWIDAPHGDIEEVPSTSGSGRRGRRRAERTPEPAGQPAGPPSRSPDPPTQPPEPPSRQAEPSPEPPRPTREAPDPAAGRQPATSHQPATSDQPAAGRNAKTDAEAGALPGSRTRSADDEDGPRRREAGGPEPTRPRRLVGLIDFARDEPAEHDQPNDSDRRDDRRQRDDDREAHNGHLDIDTAPLLYDASTAGTRSRDRFQDDPMRSRSAAPQVRRGGRHRRPDPPEHFR